MKNIYKKHNSFSNFKLSKENKFFDLNKIINILKLEIKKEKNLFKKNIFENLVFDLSDNKREKKIPNPKQRKWRKNKPRGCGGSFDALQHFSFRFCLTEEDAL